MVSMELRYRVDMVTSLHIGTGTGFAKMVDDMAVRAGPTRGGGVPLPCIPGSSMKGKTRSRCQALAHGLGLRACGEPRWCKKNLCVMCRLFGSPLTQGALRFSDALLVADWQHLAHPVDGTRRTARDRLVLSLVRTGNKVERATRTVEPDFLFSIEQSAEGLRFEGSISGRVDPLQQLGLSSPLPVEGWLLLIGLQTVDKLGAGRSRGLGRCRITVTHLMVDGRNLLPQLAELLGQDEAILGVSEYETRAASHS